jgi:hypothetical protein
LAWQYSGEPIVADANAGELNVQINRISNFLGVLNAVKTFFGICLSVTGVAAPSPSFPGLVPSVPIHSSYFVWQLEQSAAIALLLKPTKAKLKIRTSPQHLSNQVPLVCSRNETSLIALHFVAIGDHRPNGIGRNANGIVPVVQNFFHSGNRGRLALVFFRGCYGCWRI